MWWAWCLVVVIAALVAFGWGCDVGRDSERRFLADEWRDLQRLRADLLRREAEGRVRHAAEHLIAETRGPLGPSNYGHNWESYE